MLFVGITIKGGENRLFNNGLNQNAIYLYMLLKSFKGVCPVLIGDELASFDQMETLLMLNYYKFDIIIQVSIRFGENAIQCFAKRNTVASKFFGGTKLIHDKYVFALKGQRDVGVPNEKTECPVALIPPQFWEERGYIQYTSNFEKIMEAPYLWDPYCINMYGTVSYEHVKDVKVRQSVVIVEPNMGTEKCALVPFGIFCGVSKRAISIHLMERIYFYNCEHIVKNKTLEKFIIRSCEHHSKICICARNRITDIYNKKGSIVLHHQEGVQTNYAVLEAFYLHCPVIHNSKMWKKYGYYYETVEEGVEQLEYVLEHHYTSDLKTYYRKCDELVYINSIHNPRNRLAWKNVLQNMYVPDTYFTMYRNQAKQFGVIIVPLEGYDRLKQWALWWNDIVGNMKLIKVCRKEQLDTGVIKNSNAVVMCPSEYIDGDNLPNHTIVYVTSSSKNPTFNLSHKDKNFVIWTTSVLQTHFDEKHKILFRPCRVVPELAYKEPTSKPMKPTVIHKGVVFIGTPTSFQKGKIEQLLRGGIHVTFRKDVNDPKGINGCMVLMLNPFHEEDPIDGKMVWDLHGKGCIVLHEHSQERNQVYQGIVYFKDIEAGIRAIQMIENDTNRFQKHLKSYNDMISNLWKDQNGFELFNHKEENVAVIDKHFERVMKTRGIAFVGFGSIFDSCYANWKKWFGDIGCTTFYRLNIDDTIPDDCLVISRLNCFRHGIHCKYADRIIYLQTEQMNSFSLSLLPHYLQDLYIWFLCEENAMTFIKKGVRKFKIVPQSMMFDIDPSAVLKSEIPIEHRVVQYSKLTQRRKEWYEKMSIFIEKAVDQTVERASVLVNIHSYSSESFMESHRMWNLYHLGFPYVVVSETCVDQQDWEGACIFVSSPEEMERVVKKLLQDHDYMMRERSKQQSFMLKKYKKLSDVGFSKVFG